MKYSYIRFDL